MNLLKRMLATCGFSALAAVGVATGAAQAQDFPSMTAQEPSLSCTAVT